jgi:Dolichyl-phosphate-mannose-protein mannosyltransferase
VKKRYQFFLLMALAAISSAIFISGIHWGLPSLNANPFLFGSHPVWSGQEILALSGPATANSDRSTDVSAHPLTDLYHPVIVNQTDEERARIVRRYRLMSHHPDEFITFASLAQMNPSRRQFDPHMYKYGGLWIYPIGAMLKIAGMARIIQFKPDMAWYLDHPESFGSFYVVARFYSALWGILGTIVVFLLVRRISGSIAAAFAGALCFVLEPVVVNAAHEAKPHLAGTVLMLITVLAAARYAELGTWRRWLTAVTVAGLAVGMVISSLPVLLVLIVAEYIRYKRFPQVRFISTLVRMAGVLIVTGLIYCITNPYVPINLLLRPAIVRSNFGATAGFFHAGIAGIPNAVLLIGFGASFVLACAGIAGMVAFAVHAFRKRNAADPGAAQGLLLWLLLSLLALAICFQFIVLAGGQPADYARFALFFDVYLAIMAVVSVQKLVRSAAGRAACFAILILTTGWMGSLYVRGFVRDSGPNTTRILATPKVQEVLGTETHTLATAPQLEPAPWSLPPADLWRWTIMVPPRGNAQETSTGAKVIVRPVDLPAGSRNPVIKALYSTPISWASKIFVVETRP